MEDQTYLKYCEGVGRISLAWALFEHNLDYYIWELMGVDEETGVCLTAQMIGPGPRFRTLVSLAGHRGGSAELLKSLNSFAERAQQLGNKRNRVTHDPALLDLQAGKMVRIRATADRKLIYKREYVDLEDLKRLGEEIFALNAELVLCVANEIAAEIKAWPQTPTSQSP